MRMGVPQGHEVLRGAEGRMVKRYGWQRLETPRVQKPRYDQLQPVTVLDCHPFSEFILSEAEGLWASAYLVAGNTSSTCGTPKGMKVLRSPVIASTRRVRGNPTVLVLKTSWIASVALLPRNDPGL